jgi:hypothetical protein
MKINLKIHDKVIPAILLDSETSRDFISLLPMTITMFDLFRREKFGALPMPLSCDKEIRTRSCGTCDIVYWAPAADIAIFHGAARQDVTGGVHILGKIDVGAEVFEAPGPVQVTVELALQDRSKPGASKSALSTPRGVEAFEACTA